MADGFRLGINTVVTTTSTDFGDQQLIVSTVPTLENQITNKLYVDQRINVETERINFILDNHDISLNSISGSIEVLRNDLTDETFARKTADASLLEKINLLFKAFYHRDSSGAYMLNDGNYNIQFSP